jgi:hypothetical protein
MFLRDEGSEDWVWRLKGCRGTSSTGLCPKRGKLEDVKHINLDVVKLQVG